MTTYYHVTARVWICQICIIFSTLPDVCNAGGPDNIFIFGLQIQMLLFVPKQFKCFCSIVFQEGLLKAIFALYLECLSTIIPPGSSVMLLWHSDRAHLYASQFEKPCVGEIHLKGSKTPLEYLFNSQISLLQLGFASVLLRDLVKLFMLRCVGINT